MARYFFDLHNDLDVRDNEGRELPHADAVVAEAVKEAREMIKASIDETGRIDLWHQINVRDDLGNTVLVIRFEDAVTVQRGTKILSAGSTRFTE